MRLGLGCMRIPGDRFAAVLEAAIARGITCFDTARAYGNEERLAGVSGTVITKCGMRPGWVPDGRARTILDDARESHRLLGRPADLLLLHAPDPKVSFATSVRALCQAKNEGHARAIGLSNIGLRELDQAMELAEISAVSVSLGGFDDAPARNGLLRACSERSITVHAHSVFGGPRRAARLLRDRVLVEIARERETSSASVLLAYLRALSPMVVPLLGATRVESLLECTQEIELDQRALDRLDARFIGLGRHRSPKTAPSGGGEVIMIMGLAGAGKSRLARTLGGLNINRDARGGTLKGVASAMVSALAAGERRIVLDNTYLGRAVRADVIAAARENGAQVRCLFVDTPPAEAQINVVLRMLERRGRLLGPEELVIPAKEDPNLLGPTALFRMQRELEPPSLGEGFSALEVVPFVRAPWASDGPGRAVSIDCVVDGDGKQIAPLPPGEGPVLVFGHREGFTGTLSIVGDPDIAICPHPGAIPRCWCRPPLPGLLVEWAVRRRVDLSRSTLFGSSNALARTLGLSRALET